MSYKYITDYNSPNFATPDQSMALWGVPRTIENIAIHWWGDPATNPTFEGVIAHLDDPNSNVSAHYVATGDGRRVACLVDPANISYSTMADNPKCISIECDLRCRDEDYDVVAELVADIRSAYGSNLPLVPHRQFYNTQCPGNWDRNRINEIASRKVSHDPWGAVTDLNPPAPQPVVTPPVALDPTPVPVDLPPIPEPDTAPPVTLPASSVPASIYPPKKNLLESVETIATNMVVTFFQVAFATWTAAGFGLDKVVIASVVGSGTSAVWNVVLKPLLKKIGWIG